MDNEQQKDELVALGSIYSNEEFSFNLENHNYEVVSKIFITLPENFFITYRDSSDEKPKKKFISHLPPLTLLLKLPSDYPQITSPKFILRSSWLSPISLTKLCKKLDQLWIENKGQEILFTWIGFLQSETLQFLNIQECLNIDHLSKLYEAASEKNEQGKIYPGNNPTDVDQTHELQSSAENNSVVENQRKKLKIIKKISRAKNKKIIDKRAKTDILVGKSPVQVLVDYNSMRDVIEFRKNFYTCKICFSDKLGENCLKFLPCSHVFCKECLVSYFEMKIKEGTVMNIFCPEEKCKSEATPDQIKDLVTPELFSKYDSILLSVTLDTMTDIIYCPRKSCQYPVSREPNEVMANCPVCQYAFCTFCKAVYHGIEPCKVNSAEKKNLVAEYQKASDEKKVELELRYGKKQLQSLVENTMSEDWIDKNSQNCPSCDAAIEKSDGCNKMTCWKCNTFFCWKCRKELLREDPYSHYRDPHSGCFNMLYHGLLFEEDDDDEDLQDLLNVEDDYDFDYHYNYVYDDYVEE